jgi:hypothetical protein
MDSQSFVNLEDQQAKWQPLADAVEKVRGILLTRNNRIIGVDFLNRTCAFDAHFESILLRDPPKSFFDSIDQLRPSGAKTAVRSCAIQLSVAAGALGRCQMPAALPDFN